MKIRVLFVFVITMAALGSLHAADLDLEKEYKREIALYHIRPDQSRSLKRDSDGTPVSEPRLKEAVREFYDRLYPLDPIFLKRFQIRSVVFKDTVYDRDGGTRQQLRIGSDLYLDADLATQQFYVNMFYLQISLMPRTYLERWNKLNPDGFKYEEMRGNLSNSAQKKLDAVLAEWDKHFVSRAGMFSTEMDMALTFAYMIEKGPAATAFVKKNSPNVQKKFDLIFDILESVKAAERGYMQTLLADDLSKLRTYVPYALAVRLEREYSGVWSVPEDGKETDREAEETKPPRKIGDPVEVAGRKVIPLILALETNNNCLFKLLMEGKADPDVANDKKVSALMLAIANNDPEQVKALLGAGAKVTQEAARVGTASGVNVEIVKLMKSYLPGVRAVSTSQKPTGPEKKVSDGALYRRLNETVIDHFDFEEVRLASVIDFLQTKSRQPDSAGKGVDIVVDPETEKKSHLFVTLAANNVSLYDAISLICKNAGVAFYIDEAGQRVIIRPKPGETGSAKEKP